MTVIAIIGVLSAIVIGGGRYASEAGRIAKAKAELAALTVALEGYKQQYGDYPRTADAAELLQALIGKRGPTGVSVQDRALVELARFTTASGLDPFETTSAELIDPWERSYIYVYKTPAAGWTNPGYVLYSMGPDAEHDPVLLAGGFAKTAVAQNADNLYANR